MLGTVEVESVEEVVIRDCSSVGWCVLTDDTLVNVEESCVLV